MFEKDYIKNEEKRVFSLSNVMDSINRTLTNRYKSSFWVRAEMIRLNFYKQSGHCYPDLIEKKGGKIVAQIRAILWKDDYIRNDARFRQTLGEPLKDGITLLFLAKITFEAAHGLTLQILDIEPEYTLGNMEREKHETIQRLKKEGIFDNNHALKLTPLTKRIAVISVETSRGYRDFLNKIEQSKYKPFHLLFPAVLQGDKVVASISEQLQRVQKVMHHFDALAIIRGGGGDIALSEYNNYALTRQIALFPIPILTGIGHATNETAVEMVACRNLVTPAGLADFIIQQCSDFDKFIQRAEKQLATLAKQFVENERIRLHVESVQAYSKTTIALTTYRHNIAHLQNQIPKKITQQITNQFAWLEKTQLVVKSIDPSEILKRGYSLTLFNGQPVKDITQIKKGETLKTFVHGGIITSAVKNIRKNNIYGKKKRIRKKL